MGRNAKYEDPNNSGKKAKPRKKKNAVGELVVKQYQPTMLSYVLPNVDPTDNNGMDDNPKSDDETSPAYKRAIDGLLDWLETDNNYKIVFSQEKISVGTKPEAMASAWERAAVFVTAYVNKTRGSRESEVKYSGLATRERAHRHKIKNFEVARAAKKTGAGVEERSGADSFDEQLELDCRHYKRMEKLFGKNPHLVPAFRVTTGLSKGQSIINLTGRTKNVDVQQAPVGECVDRGIPKGVIDVESWTRGENYNHLSDDEAFEADQDYSQDPQGVSKNYEGVAFSRYRSQRGSTITSNTESKKRPHDVAKGESDTISNSNPRRAGPQNLYTHQPPGKNKSLTNDMLNELLFIKLHKSKGKTDNPDPETTAQSQLDREMAMNQQKYHHDIKAMQMKTELDLKRLKGEALLHGVLNNKSPEELDAIEARFNRMIRSVTSTAVAVDADNAEDLSAQIAKDPTPMFQRTPPSILQRPQLPAF